MSFVIGWILSSDDKTMILTMGANVWDYVRLNNASDHDQLI